MPTTRPRHVITETPAVAAALDEAARRWPDEAGSRSRLLLRLVELGRAQLNGQREQAVAERRRVIAETAGILVDAYPPGYLDELRRDWPA